MVHLAEEENEAQRSLVTHPRSPKSTNAFHRAFSCITGATVGHKNERKCPGLLRCENWPVDGVSSHLLDPLPTQIQTDGNDFQPECGQRDERA